MDAWPELTDPARWFRADGAGNTFWMLDARGVWPDLPPEAVAQAPAVCERGPSAWTSEVQPGFQRSADGWLVLCDAGPGAVARMVLLNADGSRPEACGNALRCIARWLGQEQRMAGVWVIATDAGPRSVGLGGEGLPWADMGAPEVLPGSHTVRVGHETWSGWRISMGNPHFVLRLNGVEDWRVPEIGAALSTHATFPEGTNVEFPYRNGNGLRLRVWERGVGETLACGTGACAAAYVHHFQHGAQDPLDVHMPGGRLRVTATSGGLRLSGPARVEPYAFRQGAAPLPGS